MINLSQIQTLQQRLTPQQVQYLKMLQMPALALEQNIKAELEQNPLLEEADDIEITADGEADLAMQQERNSDTVGEEDGYAEKDIIRDDFTYEDFANDESSYKTPDSYTGEVEDFPTPNTITLTDSLREQIQELDLSPTEQLIAEEIIGNIDPDGYLRRNLQHIVDDLNQWLASADSIRNNADNNEVAIINIQGNGLPSEDPLVKFDRQNNGEHPATQNGQAHKDSNVAKFHSAQATAIDIQTAERILAKIHRLDPVGIGARSLQECLTIQLQAIPNRTPSQELALRMINECFNEFAYKHFDAMRRALETTDEAMQAALEEIRKLNPKPGNNSFGVSEQTVLPDFIVERDGKDLLISLNDSWLPHVRVSENYKSMLSTDGQALPRDAKLFLRQKLDSAKLFITSLQQRRITMMATMRAIVELQRDFFLNGEKSLKPIFYRHVAERIGMDVSTVCRVVSNKYVQCDWGMYDLHWFFSDSIATLDGEDVSNRVIKTRVKEIIQNEDKLKPLNDDEIVKILTGEGFVIARRTVAKYRIEQDIPVARMRKEMSKII